MAIRQLVVILLVSFMWD